MSLVRQAELLDISRASLYYAPCSNEKDLPYTHAIDKIYTDHPFLGSRSIVWALNDDYGLKANRKKVQRLMREMGIEAIYPKQHLSAPALGHQIYPYLLRNLAIARPNQVWGTDITYLKMERGFCYLTAILDWFSRAVLAWEVSEKMDVSFCAASLRSALARAIPEIHNSDQGAQFTSGDYTGILDARGVSISMDGRDRCMDNIFTERLWRTVKYEDVYLKNYRTIDEAREGLSAYFTFYNEKRRHQSLEYKTPAQVYGAGA